mmetsp:Transcript_89819/g.159760  ORF Transcript_89819/g.159760 Transcript_89819/m.159760 type:complete len:230 (-) Transcript_89819:281-970(-)
MRSAVPFSPLKNVRNVQLTAWCGKHHEVPYFSRMVSAMINAVVGSFSASLLSKRLRCTSGKAPTSMSSHLSRAARSVPLNWMSYTSLVASMTGKSFFSFSKKASSARLSIYFSISIATSSTNGPFTSFCEATIMSRGLANFLPFGSLIKRPTTSKSSPSPRLARGRMNGCMSPSSVFQPSLSKTSQPLPSRTFKNTSIFSGTFASSTFEMMLFTASTFDCATFGASTST